MVQPKTDKKKRVASLSRSLRAKIRLSTVALAIERFAQAFWPSVTTLLMMLSLLMWQAHAVFPFPVDLGLYGVLSILFLYFLVKAIRGFTRITQDEAIIRLDAGEDGNPVTTLIDRQFIGVNDEASKELWQLHRQRMAKLAEKLDVQVPKVRLAKHDPWALRLVVLLFFGSAVFFGRANTQDSFIAVLQDLASGTTGKVVSFEAWAEPPAYTGLPAIYLNTMVENTVLEVPEATRLILRNYSPSALDIINNVGGVDEEQVTLVGETELTVMQSGPVVLKKGLRAVARWDIKMIPDSPPTVKLAGKISRTIQGSVQIPYVVQDDYGIVGGTVKITLDMGKLDRRFGLLLAPENTDPISFDLLLPFNTDTADFTDTVVEDLAKHVWAGLPVMISLSVVDAAGHEVAIDPVFMPMPGKRFFDTLAAALVEQRRDLLWNRDNIDRVNMILKTLTYLPEDGFPGPKSYLMVRSVIHRMDYITVRPIGNAMLGDMAETLWWAALLIEDGDLSNAAARLKRAQDRLSEAMKNGATKEEIAELMDELRQATEEYLRQLAQNPKPDDQQAGAENAVQIPPGAIQEMMDRIQELMEQGRMDEAQALMDQLQQMLENIQVTNSGGEGDKDQKSAEGLQDTLREQQELADENFQQMQEEFDRNQEGQNKQGQEQKESKKGGAEQGAPQFGNRSDLAGRQEALRELMNQQLKELTPDDSAAGQAAREALREAERQMGQARDNLEQGRGVEALDDQAEAVEALRQGMRQLNEASRQAGQARDGQQNSDTAGPDGQDPLGRSTSERGSANSNKRLLQSGEQLRRSKEILEEIRRRSGERTRPQLELDYLDRLLDRF